MDSYLVSIGVTGVFDARTVVVKNNNELSYLIQLLAQSQAFMLISVERIPCIENYEDMTQLLRDEIKPDNLNFG